MTETTDNLFPLSGAILVIVVITIVLMGSYVVVVSISQIEEIPVIARNLTIQIYCLSIFLAWFCYGVSDDSYEYAKRFLKYASFYGIFVAMTIVPSPMLFWAGLIAYTAWGLVIRYEQETNGTDEASTWARLAPYLSIAWISSNIFILLGMISGPYLPGYSAPLLQITERHTYLDWRLLITVSFVLIFAVHSAWRTGKPARPSLEKVEAHRYTTFGSTRNILLKTINLYYGIANGIFVVVSIIRNAWRRTVKLAFFWCVAVVRLMWVDIKASFRNMRFSETIVKVALTFAMVLVLSMVVTGLAGRIRTFLINQEPMTMVITGLARWIRTFLINQGPVTFDLNENYLTFLLLVALFVSCFFAINILASIWRLSSDVPEKITISAIGILFSWMVVGVAIYILTDLKMFGLRSYSLGIYYATMAAIVILAGASFSIYKSISGLIDVFRR